MATITTKDMETLDLTLWRAGRREPGAVEAVLDINPGLAARTPVLPARITITLPPPARRAILPTIRLWD